MKKYLCLAAIIVQLFGVTVQFCAEYMYPVATYNNEIVLFHQIDTKQTNILLWNPETENLTSLLPAYFCPVNVKILPDNSGFSFIHHGRIHIKKWNSRSCRSINLFEPIYNIEQIEWLTSEICYFHAKYGEHFGIYGADLSGKVICIIQKDSADCMYPQIKNEKLFYIERINDPHKKASVHSVILNPAKMLETMNNDRNMELSFVDTEKASIIFDNNQISENLIFLTMISTKKGYVITYNPKIKHEQENIDFSVYYITHQSDGWSNTKLFSFMLPLELINGENQYRLFESIVPCLPKWYKNIMYYVTTQKNDYFMESTLKKYDLNNNCSSTIVHYKFNSLATLLPPLHRDEICVYGGTMGVDKTQYSLPFLYPFNDSYKAYVPVSIIP